MSSPRVFISYTHDSEEHKNRVFDLSDRLRAEGVDCHIDQYEDSPPEGWARWMHNQIQDSDYVLVVCTETYKRRFEGKEAVGKGIGAKWEGAIITQHLYESEGRNSKFIPVALSEEDVTYIPLELRQGTRYVLNTEEGYNDLYFRLTDQRRRLKRALGELRALPALERKQDFHPTSNQKTPDKPTQKAEAKTTSMILIVSPEGLPLFFDASRIERGDTISMSLVPENARESAAIESLRKPSREPIGLSYGMNAVFAQVQSVKQVVEGGREVWHLELQLDGSYSRGSVVSEYNLSGYSTDVVAEMRAKRILLDEKLQGSQPGRMNDLNMGMLEHAVQGYSSRFQVLQSPFPSLYKAAKGKIDDFLEAAKLYAVLLLLLTNTVEQIHKLDLKMKSDRELAVNFAGQRARQYSNQDPHPIKVKGICVLFEEEEDE
jgi:TIR domain